MKKITLDCGAEINIDEKDLGNMELLDELVAVDEGDTTALTHIFRLIMSKEDKKKLYDALREEGRVPVAKVVAALKELFDKLGEQGKN